MKVNDTHMYNMVEDFVQNRIMFTSVDISNAIKREGTWVPNSDVTTYLRTQAESEVPDFFDNIVASFINITLDDGTNVSTRLYHWFDQDEADYTPSGKGAMTPEVFDKLHGFNPVADKDSTDVKVSKLDNLVAKSILGDKPTVDNTGDPMVDGIRSKFVTVFKFQRAN